MLNFYILTISMLDFNKHSKKLQREKQGKNGVKKWLLPLGLLVVTIGSILAMWHSYELKKSRTNLWISEAKQAFKDAIATEIRECVDVRFSQYDPNLSTVSGTEQSKIAWADQEALTLEDSLRLRLNDFFRQKLDERGINFLAEIRCNHNGKIYTSNKENSLDHTFLLAEECFQNGKRFIKLQAYLQLPEEASQASFVPFLLIVIAAVIGMVGWYIMQKRNEKVFTKKGTEQQQPVIQKVVLPEKAQEEIVLLKYDIQYYKLSNTVARAERRSHLNGKSIIYFEAFVAKEDYILTYKEISDLCIKQRRTPSIAQEETLVSASTMSHAMNQLEFQLKPIGIQIKNIRSKGYQMIFPDEAN